MTIDVTVMEANKFIKQSNIRTKGWIGNVRDHGSIIFIDLFDSTGCIQVVVQSSIRPPDLRQESYISVDGSINNRGIKNEIIASNVRVLSTFDINLSPLPHGDFDVFNIELVDKLLSKRHVYIRNPQLQAVMKFRHKYFRCVNNLFDSLGFIEINGPILTQALLYEERTAFKLQYFSEEVYLTQCVGFYLEACALAFEKVYSIGPSFRAESSKSRRHLSEYWHIKAEMLDVNRDGLIIFVESFIHALGDELLSKANQELEYLNSPLKTINLKPPYPQITYREAIDRVRKLGIEVEFGRSLSSQAEDALSMEFNTPFWIVGLPSKVEPFPYVIDPDDSEITMTADLHAPSGFGELLGVAEKISNYDNLLSRANEKGLSSEQISRLDWYFELHKSGCLSHGGLGIGVERMIRWLLHLPHVRDTIPFPRLFGRICKP